MDVNALCYFGSVLGIFVCTIGILTGLELWRTTRKNIRTIKKNS